MYKILIADDEWIERKVLTKIIKEYLQDSCEIYEAENGRAAVEISEREEIQIALMDIEMPGMNGIEAASKIRERYEFCNIIFVTAYDEFNYAKKAITLRALDYLLKPYSNDELLGCIDEAIRNIVSQEEKKDHVERNNTNSKHYKSQALNKEDNHIIDELEINVANQNKILTIIHEIESFIQENYNRDLSLQEVADKMNYSEAYFCRLFKQYFHKSFTTYLTEIRIDIAKELLENPVNSIKDIGSTVGYSDSGYFTKVFKRIEGVKPTEYRETVLQEKM